MNILTKAVQEIMYRIPIQILREAFKDEFINVRRGAPTSIDTKIINKVLRPRVCVDANLVGGSTVSIPLDGLTPSYVDNYTMIYEIPAELRSYRNIMSPLSVSYLPFTSSLNTVGVGNNVLTPGAVSDVAGIGQRIIDSVSNLPIISNANLQLLDENTIIFRDMRRVTNAYVLKVLLENDEQLNNLPVRTYLAFARLCELAVKSYIYNTLVIRVDEAYLTGGQELGSFKNVMDTYSDSEEMYQTELRDTWQAVAFMADQPSMNKFITLMINPGL